MNIVLKRKDPGVITKLSRNLKTAGTKALYELCAVVHSILENGCMSRVIPAQHDTVFC